MLINRVSAFYSQLHGTGNGATNEEKNKKYIAGDITFILSEVHDKMSHPGKAKTVEFIQKLLMYLI